MNLYSEIDEIRNSGRSAVLCIITETTGSSPRKAGSKMIVFNDGTIKGTIGGGAIEFQAIQEALTLIGKTEPVKKIYQLEQDLGMHCGGTMEVFFEPFGPRNSLYIFGAGHIGRVLARFAHDLGFRITLFDNRPEIFNEFDTSAYSCIDGDYLENIKNTAFDSNTFVVIVTHKHIHDEDILEACAKKDHAYLGMIGSRRKVAEATKRFLENKLMTEQQISEVNMPIGISMKVETPEEIAISILAKLIDVRNSQKKLK
ncbi:MAG: XdhC/CoxI family protein [Bacteroidota bacterium]